MQNETKGLISLFIGVSILSIVTTIIYYINSVSVWISETIGASSEASIGIQIIILIFAIVTLLSVILFGLLLVAIGVGYIFNITPFNMIEKIQKKIFGDAIVNDLYDFKR